MSADSGRKTPASNFNSVFHHLGTRMQEEFCARALPFFCNGALPPPSSRVAPRRPLSSRASRPTDNVVLSWPCAFRSRGMPARRTRLLCKCITLNITHMSFPDLRRQHFEFLPSGRAQQACSQMFTCGLFMLPDRLSFPAIPKSGAHGPDAARLHGRRVVQPVAEQSQGVPLAIQRLHAGL